MSLLLGLLLVSACDSGKDREYWGYLYFGVGSYLGKLDLRDGSVEVLANLGDTDIEALDAFGDEQLLLSVFGPVNRKDTYRLMQYEFESGAKGTLINGRYGHYLPGPEALIFDDGAHLNVRLYGGGEMQEVPIVQHRFGAKVRVLPISNTGILYSVEPDGAISSFDVLSNERTPLTALSRQCGLDGALWIAARAALLCKRQGEYVFVNTDGDARGNLEIPDATSFRVVAHLADQNALVLTENWKTLVSGSVRSSVWIYDLASDRMVRLSRDQYLGETVVYRAN